MIEFVLDYFMARSPLIFSKSLYIWHKWTITRIQRVVYLEKNDIPFRYLVLKDTPLYQYNPGFELGRYKTFKWQKGLETQYPTI